MLQCTFENYAHLIFLSALISNQESHFFAIFIESALIWPIQMLFEINIVQCLIDLFRLSNMINASDYFNLV